MDHFEETEEEESLTEPTFSDASMHSSIMADDPAGKFAVSPGTFFASRSGGLGSLDGHAPEHSRVMKSTRF
jgi:hypothetical protein